MSGFSTGNQTSGSAEGPLCAKSGTLNECARSGRQALGTILCSVIHGEACEGKLGGVSPATQDLSGCPDRRGLITAWAHGDQRAAKCPTPGDVHDRRVGQWLAVAPSRPVERLRSGFRSTSAKACAVSNIRPPLQYPAPTVFTWSMVSCLLEHCRAAKRVCHALCC